LYHLREYDFELFSSFLQQCFMHFYTSQRWFYCLDISFTTLWENR
jgi:hypothetical protein